jgi:hypothetical protein
MKPTPRLKHFYRSAANWWTAPLPWWVRGATFGLIFWGLVFIASSLAILTEHQHSEHIDTIMIVCWFGSLFFTGESAFAFINLPRDCSEPANWKEMTLYDPAKEILGTSSSDFKKEHFRDLDFDTYRDGKGNEYTRYVEPNGRVSWKRWKRKRLKK